MNVMTIQESRVCVIERQRLQRTSRCRRRGSSKIVQWALSQPPHIFLPVSKRDAMTVVAERG